MYKISTLLLSLVILVGCIVGCTDNNQTSVEINFASIVGKYTGTEKSCATNTGDTLCSGILPAQYNIILRSSNNIQLNPIAGNIPGGLYIYEAGVMPSKEDFVFKSANGYIMYHKSVNTIKLFFGGAAMSNFIVFEGAK